MQVVDNKALLLRTRSPDKFAIIPKSHYVGPVEDGLHEILVYWGLDEARVLRNLGVKDAPSPILRDYNWPGKYRPMEHQKDTASFLTLHRRAFVFNDPGCVDSETEYLSPTGWRKISEYVDGDVAQYHPDSGEIEFVAPEKYVKIPCDEMVRIKTHYGLDQMLSPEHRVLVRSNVADKWRVTSAAELLRDHDDYHAGRTRTEPRQVGGPIAFSNCRIPTAFSSPGGKGILLTDEQLRVQVAVMADGHFPNKTNYCVVRLKRERKKERLRALLTAAGIPFKEREATAVSAAGFRIFTFAAPWRVKEYDARFWDASPTQLTLLAEESIHWDGTVREGNKGPSFSTTSKASADFIQYAWAAQGRTARVYEDTRDKYRGGVCYTVQVRRAKEGDKHGLLALRNRTSPTITLAPSTDGFKYCFTVPSTFLLFRRNGCIFASGNTGKTISALWAADYLMRKGLVRRVLIVAPLSILQSAWQADASRSVIHRSIAVAHHPQAERRIEVVQGGYEIVVCNYDGLPLISSEIRTDGRFDLIIVDEANHYKNPSTRRWKALNSLVNPDTWLWMMTGTPAAQSPEDAFGLAKLVNPKAVPYTLTTWRDKVMLKVSTFRWIPKPNAKDTVHEVLQPAIRYTKEQCLDLPPVMTETRIVEMTAQQKKYYQMLKEQLLIETAGESISAVNAAAAVSKLLQISGGTARTDTQEVVEFDVTPRLNVVQEVCEETDRKIIIFALFRAAMDTITDFLTKRGFAVEQIHGGVAASKRHDIISRFQYQDSPRILVMQPQATAHGITLTRADTVVFYGPLMSIEQYVQCIARADRQGQNADSVRVIHIQSSPIEEKMFRVLEARVEDHAMLSKMFESEVGKPLTAA